MNARISFVPGTYTLVHASLNLYPHLLQPILRVLLPQTQSVNASEDSLDRKLEGLNIDNQHGFLNISITPLECSVVCHSSWAHNVFGPVIKSLPQQLAKDVSIFEDKYIILCVTSAGLNAAGRVMELSSPLALAGIPIFITTYYADFILVPLKERQKVIKALSEKGFELSENESSFVNPQTFGHRTSSTPPMSPTPAASLSNEQKLQKRTFELLQKRQVSPYVVQGLQLDATCTVEDPRSLIENVDTKLYTCIVSALVSKPRFMSLTLAEDDPPSLLLDRKLLHIFRDTVIGDLNSSFVPIFLDLGNLPSEVTGIVCGVAGRLVEKLQFTETSELSYLSTARASAVILTEQQSERALDIMKPLLRK